MSLKVDYNKLKLFGIPRSHLRNKVYDPSKIKYLESKRYGKFITNASLKNREIHHLISNNRQIQTYERYFNPLGFKTRITENFPKPANVEHLNDFKFILLRSLKDHKPNQLKFVVDINMDKILIKQVLEKLYDFKILKVTTAIQPGKVKRIQVDVKRGNRAKYIRVPDRKVAVITLDKEVPESLRKLKLRNSSDEHKDCRNHIIHYKPLPSYIPSVQEAKEIIPEGRKKLLGLRSITTLTAVKRFIEERKIH